MPEMFRPREVIVLNEDVPAYGLRRGDLGTIINVHAAEALEVAFYTTSGRTRALAMLPPSIIRHATDHDR
jgi:uncharacterized protein DUF4926